MHHLTVDSPGSKNSQKNQRLGVFDFRIICDLNDIMGGLGHHDRQPELIFDDICRYKLPQFATAICKNHEQTWTSNKSSLVGWLLHTGISIPASLGAVCPQRGSWPKPDPSWALQALKPNHNDELPRSWRDSTHEDAGNSCNLDVWIALFGIWRWYVCETI